MAGKSNARNANSAYLERIANLNNERKGERERDGGGREVEIEGNEQAGSSVELFEFSTAEYEL